jgi:hypothetical protein
MADAREKFAENSDVNAEQSTADLAGTLLPVL